MLQYSNSSLRSSARFAFFFRFRRQVQKTGDAANNYKRRENAEVDEDGRNHQQQGIDMRMLAQIMAQMTGAMGGNRNPRRGNGVDADEDDDLD